MRLTNPNGRGKPRAGTASRPAAGRGGRLSARLKLVLGGLAALLLLGASTVGTAAAEATASREYLIKAAILYNFARFTEWPEQVLASQGEFRLCILGADPFGAALASIENKPVQGRPVAIVLLRDPAQAASCQLLYLSSSEAARATQVLEALGAAPVLTVAEIPLFNRGGGHIEMLTIDDRVRFGINQGGAERVGLKFSAKLLNLADPTFDGNQGTRYAAPR